MNRKRAARKRRAIRLLEDGYNRAIVARETGLSYTTVWHLAEPIRQRRRAAGARAWVEEAERLHQFNLRAMDETVH